MNFKRYKYNFVVLLLVVIIGVVITAPMLMWGDSASGEELEEFIPPILGGEDPGHERPTYNFKTAMSALKQGNEGLKAGYTSVVSGSSEMLAVGIPFRFEANGYKYINPKDDTAFLALTLGTRNLPFYKIDLDDYFSQITKESIISYCVDRTEGENFLVPYTVADFQSKGGFLPASNWLGNLPASSIISSRIEKFSGYQKVIMKVKAETMQGLGVCLLSPMRIRCDYKTTAPADVVFYISNYGDFLNVQYSMSSELILHSPFGVIKAAGTFGFGETFYNVQNNEVVQKYENVVEKYPQLLPIK